jgi:hypothetical protein
MFNSKINYKSPIMAESLYQFYSEQSKKVKNDENLKRICLLALSLIPVDLTERLKGVYNQTPEFSIVIKLPEVDFNPRPYEENIKDFILMCLCEKYGKYGWGVTCWCGREITITFDAAKYAYFKDLIAMFHENNTNVASNNTTTFVLDNTNDVLSNTNDVSPGTDKIRWSLTIE